MIRFLPILVVFFQLTHGMVITIHKEMSLGDLFNQGIYPSAYSYNQVLIQSDELKVKFDDTEKAFGFSNCDAHLTFSTTGELLGAVFFDREPYAVTEGAVILRTAADAMEIELSSERFPLTAKASTSGVSWTSLGGEVTLNQSGWGARIQGRRDRELLFIMGEIYSPIPVKERLQKDAQWLPGDFIKSPNEWSYLPLSNCERGDSPDIQAFTYLVSSYDENGKLLPEFAERKKAIEAELVAQAPPRVSPPPRKTTDSTEEVKEAIENMDFWPWLVGGGLAAFGLLVWVLGRKKV